MTTENTNLAADSAAGDITTDELVERVVVWVQGILGADEFVRAKDEFYLLFGKVFPEDSFFEARMNYFLEYFVFLRPISAGVKPEYEGKTPFLLYCERTNSDSGSGSDERTIAHSLYQIIRHRPDNMIVKDLIAGTKHKILPKSEETFCGFGKKDIFQGFIFTSGDRSHVSYGVVIHPRKAEAAIKKMVKTARNLKEINGDEMLKKLALLQVRAARHSHVNPKLIYTAPPR